MLDQMISTHSLETKRQGKHVAHKHFGDDSGNFIQQITRWHQKIIRLNFAILTVDEIWFVFLTFKIEKTVYTPRFLTL